MNNEIKEILDDLDKNIDLLLDYITNLQQENERLTNELNTCMIERNNFLSRIDKVIDYIKEHKKEITKTQANIFNEDRQDKPKLKVGTFMWNVDELEDILRGNKDE